MSQPRGARRRGFTLVELMVVIAIMAVLGMLVVPAVINARKTAKIGAIKAEIEMLSTAMNYYKTECGGYPPCSSGTAAGSPMVRHLQRLFPRCDVTGHLAAVGSGSIAPENALPSWLLGYTGVPTSPLSPSADRRQFFNFDKSRLTSGVYTPVDEPDSPYVYIDSGTYGTLVSGTVASRNAFVVGSGTYRAETRLIGTGTTFFNPDTFQILCAGIDGIWGTDDDLSNFWKRTRGDFKTTGQ